MLHTLSFYTAKQLEMSVPPILPTLSGNQRIDSLHACKNWYIQSILLFICVNQLKEKMYNL